MQEFKLELKKWDSSTAKRLNNSRVVPIFVQSICVTERMWGRVEFSFCFCHIQPFHKPAADAGRREKKELRLFDSRHKPRKWKDRLRWLKALGRQLIFSRIHYTHTQTQWTWSVYGVYEYRWGKFILRSLCIYWILIILVGRQTVYKIIFLTKVKKYILPKKHIRGAFSITDSLA